VRVHRHFALDSVLPVEAFVQGELPCWSEQWYDMATPEEMRNRHHLPGTTEGGAWIPAVEARRLVWTLDLIGRRNQSNFDGSAGQRIVHFFVLTSLKEPFMPRTRDLDNLPGCSMEAVIQIIMGKWKGVILFHLLDGTLRFNELARQTRGIAPRLLAKQLRELEEDGLVTRTVYPVVPPKVEYSLTEEALTLAPLLIGLSDWGGQWLERRGIKTLSQLESEEGREAA